MHHRLIVLVDGYKIYPNKKFRNSLEVRKWTNKSMFREGFCIQERFTSGPADWMMIGGRWSGTLTEVMLNQLLWKSCLEKLGDNTKATGLNLFFSSVSKSQKKRGEEIFKSFFPKFKGRMPIYRNEYRNLGYEDDAMMVSKKLWINLIEDLIKKSSDDYYEDPLIYLDGMIGQLTAKNTIDLKWAVVIDYHS